MEQGQNMHRKKLKPPPEYNYRGGNYLLKEWFF